MISHEKQGNADVVTILDDSGNDADLEIISEPGAPTLALVQADPNFPGEGQDVIVLTPLQCYHLMEVLKVIVREDQRVLQ